MSKPSISAQSDDDDSDDEDDAEYDNLYDDESLKCPRECTCARNFNNYLVATCSRYAKHEPKHK